MFVEEKKKYGEKILNEVVNFLKNIQIKKVYFNITNSKIINKKT